MKIGEGLDVFEHDGKTYSVVSESKTAGLAAVVYQLDIRRESKGTITAKGLRPHELRRTAQRPSSSAAPISTGRRSRPTFRTATSKQTVPLPPNTWDATSFAWNFAFVAAGRGHEGVPHRRPPGAILPLRHRGPGEARHRAGRHGDAAREKDPEDDDKRGFDVWLATERHYLPVRIRYTEKDGTAFDSVVTNHSARSRPRDRAHAPRLEAAVAALQVVLTFDTRPT